MPPEGYNTVTLPYDLVETLDDISNLSRAATIRMLVAEYRIGDRSETIDARIVDMDAAERRKFAEEVAGVLRE